MEKKRLAILLLAISLCFPITLLAETVVLKSGKMIEGEMLEKTDEYIKIDFHGIALTYFFDEISDIDGEKPAVFSAKKEELSTQTTEYPQEEQVKQEGEYYTNDEYGIKIWHPSNWQVFDKNVHPKIFKSLSPPGATASEAGLICAFSSGKDWNNLNPLIMLIVQQVSEDTRDLPAENVALVLEGDLKQFGFAASNIEYPSVITVNGKKLVKYTVISTIRGKELKTVSYEFIKGVKLYKIMCTTDLSAFDRVKIDFKNIAESIEVY